MPNYLNGRPDVEILGHPKTVKLQGRWKNTVHGARLEVWILALVETLTPEQKDQFFTRLQTIEDSMAKSRLYKADIVAAIPMANMGE